MAAVSFSVSVPLLLVWRKIAGGKLTFKKFVIVPSYFAGVSSQLLLIFTLLGVGIFATGSIQRVHSYYAMMDTWTRSI